MNITIANLEHSIKASVGDNLLRVLIDEGYLIDSDCGQNGTCGKCKVFDVDTQQYILSCQTKIDRDYLIEINLDTYTSKRQNKDIPNFENESHLVRNINLGLAIDIGTTTIALYLFNKDNGNVIDTISDLNPQIIYGADVISRIQYAEKFGVDDLHQTLIAFLNQNIVAFKKKYGIKTFEEAYISGNTTMLHIFMNINPRKLGYYPFTPDFLGLEKIHGNQVGLNCDKVMIMPSISAFIGSDITMGIIACDLPSNNRSLLIDLGTNGEIVLVKDKRLYAASTALGPAFEGASIECGSVAKSGAIDTIRFEEGKLIYSCIGDTPAKSLTGTAIIDLIAISLNRELIDSTGKINGNSTNDIQDRINVTDNIYLSQKDIRQIQLAKSALRSGIDILLQKAGLTIYDIEKIYVSGSFGFYINPEHAMSIGLLPRIPLNKIEVIGNSSASGTIICSIDNEKLDAAIRLTHEVEVIDLSSNQDFNEMFMNNMFFNQN